MSETSPLSKLSIGRFFKTLPDPRHHRGKIVHPLLTIVVLALCGTIAGADDFEMIVTFAKERFEWFAKIVDLSNGIPSHDTFERVFARLDPLAFQRCLLQWVQALHKATGGKVIAIDGKAVREAMNRSKDKGPLCLVTAWACANHLLLGQVAGPEGSNELGALPALLELLELNGAIVTLDALGCQKAIVKQIVDQKGDYVIAVKENQEKLYEAVLDSFEKAFNGAPLPASQTHETTEQGHGRVEKRTVTVIEVPEALEEKEQWSAMRSFVMVTRETTTKKSAEPIVGVRYYISSLLPKAKTLGEIVRGHWGIENQLHWQLDVSFREDTSRARQKNAQANLGIVRRVALSLIKNTANLKGSVKSKRHQAGWSEKTLEAILFGIPIDNR